MSDEGAKEELLQELEDIVPEETSAEEETEETEE
jgi:hypothetical protein